MAKTLFLACGTALFAGFAALQFNDATQYGNRDAWTWIALYGLMATLNLGMIWRNIPRHWLFAWAGFCWGALLFRLQDAQGNLHVDWLHPANYWDQNHTMVQHANESGGLLILALWASITIFVAKNASQ